MSDELKDELFGVATIVAQDRQKDVFDLDDHGLLLAPPDAESLGGTRNLVHVNLDDVNRSVSSLTGIM